MEYKDIIGAYLIDEISRCRDTDTVYLPYRRAIRYRKLKIDPYKLIEIKTKQYLKYEYRILYRNPLLMLIREPAYRSKKP